MWGDAQENRTGVWRKSSLDLLQKADVVKAAGRVCHSGHARFAFHTCDHTYTVYR